MTHVLFELAGKCLTTANLHLVYFFTSLDRTAPDMYKFILGHHFRCLVSLYYCMSKPNITYNNLIWLLQYRRSMLLDHTVIKNQSSQL